MNASGDEKAPTRHQIRDNATVRLAVRDGDYLSWVVADSPFTSDANSAWNICDVWQLRDGDFVTITNRLADLPVWFELHPLEVAGGAARGMMEKLAQGYKPSDPMDGPNIWRVRSGDRLVWVTVTGSVVREIFDFKSCALIVGETNRELDLGVCFGAPDDGEPPPEVAALVCKGFEAAAKLGLPRTFSPRWKFGA